MRQDGTDWERNEGERPHQQMTRRQCMAMMAGAAAAALTPRFCIGEDARPVLRLAVSAETLAGANLNDARAAYKVWVRELNGQLGYVIAEPVSEVFIASEDLVLGVRQGRFDSYVATAPEFAKIVDLTDPDSLLIEDYMADGLEYVLLVHSASRFKQIADLRGAQILSHLHRDTALLPAWMSILLAANNLPSPERFFAGNTLCDKLNMVVLPVYFHRADGALLARRNWEMAVELNPQLGRDLRVITTSSKVIPVVLGFRRTTTANARKSLIDSIQRVYSVPAGKQIVALYQSTGFVVRPVSVMKGTLEMVRDFKRLQPDRPTDRK